MTLAGRARNFARRALSPRAVLDHGPVCLHGSVLDLPEPEFPAGYRHELMDMDDNAEVRRWLGVHNDAFDRHWGPGDFRAAVLEHPHYDIRQTFFLSDTSGLVGTVSIGVFRRNERIGVGHYVQILPRCQGIGLGKHLGLFRSHRLRELGVARGEAETRIGRPRSISIWFGCGWEPKLRLDHWNTPDDSSPLVRPITKRRLVRLHREWQRKHRAG